MSSRLKNNTPFGAIALTFAIATFTAGVAAAEERRPVLTNEVAHAMKRDLKMNDAQLARYFKAERIAYASEALVARRLGASYAGSWLERGADGEFRFVAATTGSTKRLMPYGVQLRQHRYSLAQLESAVEELNRIHTTMSKRNNHAGIQSWGVDVQNNRVVVTYAPSAVMKAVDLAAASSADSSMFRFEVSTDGDAVPLALAIGGNSYDTAFNQCSIGFTVQKAANDYGFISAGHCAPAGAPARILGEFVGYVQRSDFNFSGDMNFIDVEAGQRVANYVNKYDTTTLTVRGRTEAAVGVAVCRSGRQTGWRCGTIVSKNNTFSYGGVSISGLTRATACAGPGDSGGPFITGSGQAQGVTSGGVLPSGQANNCNVATPATYFQPVGEILSRYSLALFLGT